MPCKLYGILKALKRQNDPKPFARDVTAIASGLITVFQEDLFMFRGHPVICYESVRRAWVVSASPRPLCPAGGRVTYPFWRRVGGPWGW